MPMERTGSKRGPSREDVLAQEIERTELVRWLGHAVFPAEREEIIDHLRYQHAPDWVVAEVASAPPDRQFSSVGALWRTMRRR